MSAIVLHFASGGALFSGAACLLVGLLAASFGRRKLIRAVGRLMLLMAVFFVVISATPLPAWAYALWGASLATWVNSLHPRLSMRPKLRTGALIVVIGFTLLAVGWELWYQLPPRVAGGPFDRLIVIGDSLSAEDFTEGGDPWPSLLARDHDCGVLNLAFSGAKAGSAAKRAVEIDFDLDLVILEIGGNDLLGFTSPAQFEEDLERLLQTVCVRRNRVVMLELPLPPLYNRFGEVQRRLSRRYGVVLVAKRYFARVLTGEESTVDHLHLSAVGHRKMADMIWQVVSGVIRIQ